MTSRVPPPARPRDSPKFVTRPAWSSLATRGRGQAAASDTFISTCHHRAEEPSHARRNAITPLLCAGCRPAAMGGPTRPDRRCASHSSRRSRRVSRGKGFPRRRAAGATGRRARRCARGAGRRARCGGRTPRSRARAARAAKPAHPSESRSAKPRSWSRVNCSAKAVSSRHAAHAAHAVSARAITRRGSVRVMLVDLANGSPNEARRLRCSALVAAQCIRIYPPHRNIRTCRDEVRRAMSFPRRGVGVQVIVSSGVSVSRSTCRSLEPA